jgi:hypothetical protein
MLRAPFIFVILIVILDQVCSGGDASNLCLRNADCYSLLEHQVP